MDVHVDFGVLSLIVSVIGIILGISSILVTWNLYFKSDNVLKKIEQSSHTTEVVSTQYTTRLVDALISFMTDRLKTEQGDVSKRIDAAIRDLLTDQSAEVVKTLRDRLGRDLEDSFHTLKEEVAAMAQFAKRSSRAPAPAARAATAPPLDPGASKVLRWMVRNERKYKFFSVKFLRRTIFGADAVAQQGLQFCIDNGLLELYGEQNPDEPTKPPTTACRINREHPLVHELVGKKKKP